MAIGGGGGGKVGKQGTNEEVVRIRIGRWFVVGDWVVGESGKQWCYGRSCRH